MMMMNVLYINYIYQSDLHFLGFDVSDDSSWAATVTVQSHTLMAYNGENEVQMSNT